MDFTLRDQLIGALIGLARTIISNEDTVTRASIRMLLDGLIFYKNTRELNEKAFRSMIRRVRNAKRKLAPNCSYCVAPCGKNDDYDMELFETMKTSILAIKLSLLQDAQELAEYARCHRNVSVEKFIFKLLFAVGMDDWDESMLLPIVEESGELYDRIGLPRR